MRFNYLGLTSSGEEKRGSVQASDQDAAISKLHSRGIFATQIEKQDENNASSASDSITELTDHLLAYLPIKTAQKVFFFRQLALMFRSGLSVTEALNILAQIQRGRLRLIIQAMNEDISAGRSFSQALAPYESLFGALSLHMIRSAENSGELEPALLRIANFLERKQEIKTQLLSTMTYPFVVLLMTIGVFIFMMVTVIPKFAGFFERSGRTPPAEMLQLMSIAEFLTTRWYVLIIVIVVLVGGFIYSYSTRQGRLYIDKFILRIPLIGTMISASAMSQITWGLSTLLQSGVSVVKSLQIIGDLIRNRAISDNIIQASEEILRGADMGKSFHKPHIERLIQQMVLVGERSGSMISIMRDAGSFYEERIRNITKAIAAATEPAAILLIGGIVGYVYYAFFKSMFSIAG